ncbi:MAG: hypothetical protein AB7I37_12275 [Pirellulales bacterium]
MPKPMYQGIKFDLPDAYARALRARAAYEGIYPRDVIIAALDVHLARELKEARGHLEAIEPQTAAEQPQKKRRVKE